MYVYLTQLRTIYGLTARLIKELGEPDKEERNPHHPFWSYAKLYSKHRVEEFVRKHEEEIEKIREERIRRRRFKKEKRVEA